MFTKACVCRLWRCTSNRLGTFLTEGIHNLNTKRQRAEIFTVLNNYLQHFLLHRAQFAVDNTDRFHLFVH